MDRPIILWAETVLIAALYCSLVPIFKSRELVIIDSGNMVAYALVSMVVLYFMTERRFKGFLQEKRIEFLNVDPLTKLHNMNSMMDLIEGRSVEEDTVLYFDVENFKLYNIHYGMSEGDKCLCEIGKILKKDFNTNKVARFSDDHFVVLTSSKDNLLTCVDKAYDDVFTMNLEFKMKVFAGAYLMDASEEDIPANACCDKAKIACNAAKANKDAYYVFYDPSLEHNLVSKKYYADHIDEAILNGYIQVYYQPVIRALTGQVSACEALARWVDPEKGLISPGEFIPALEESFLTYKLDRYILEQAARDVRKLMDEGKPCVPFSFNLSRSDLDAFDIVKTLEDLVSYYKIPREYFRVEITETLTMLDSRKIKETIEELHEKGYLVLMDDFGSGFYSLNALRNFDFDVLKIDMDFMKNFDERARHVLRATVDMANGLNIHTLCEGVETEEQYRFLRDIGCEYIQGYYYGKPMTLHDLMPHVISKGLTVETPDQRKFYDKAAHEPISVDDEMGFIIDDGEKFEVLFLNAPFRNLCQKMGVKSYDVADLMSKRQDPWSKQIVITANRAKETNETEATFITYEDYYLQVRFKKVASGQGKTLLRMNVLNLSENRRLDVRYYDSALRYMVASFDCVYIVDMGTHDSYVVRSMFSSEANGSTVRNVDLAFQFHLDPLDVERVNQVLDAENIRERLRSTKKVKFTEYFRMLDEDGNSEWYAGTVISVPGVKLDSLLFTIEKTDANLNKSFMQ